MTSEMENREWLNEYPSLKQVNNNNPFIVPDGYFSELSERITSGIKFDELKNKMPLTGFTVPENYFGELNGNLQSRIAIENALSSNSGYTVPENYFEELSNKITSRIKVEEALKGELGLTVPENYFEELTGQISSRIFIEQALAASEESFAVPENYFDQLTNQINSRIFVEEALAKSEETFAVPQDYFAGLNKKILAQTVNQPAVKQNTTKRKGVVVKMFSSVAFKYATAACLTLMVGTGIFITKFNSPTAVHNRSFLHKQLANASVDDIQDYLQQNVDASDTQHTAVSEDLSIDDSDLKSALQDYSNTQ